MALSVGPGINIGGGINLTIGDSAAVLTTTYITSPYIAAYRWYSGSGFGAKYTDPTVLPTTRTNCIAVTAQRDAVIVGNTDYSPYVTAYQWNINTGFGTRYADPSVLPVGGAYGVQAVAFNPAGTVVAMGTNLSPGVLAYQWNSSTGFGTRYSDPGTGFSSQCSTLAWSPSGDALVAGGIDNNAARIIGYKWSDATGFGTAYTANYNYGSGGSPPVGVNQVSFSPTGDAVVWGFRGGAPDVPLIAFKWNSSTGWGTQYSNPTSPGSSTDCNGVSFTPNGSAVVYTISPGGTGVLGAYAWTYASGFGTKYTAPAVAPGGSGNISVLADGTAFAMNTGTALVVYDWNSTTGFGTRYSQSTASNGVAFVS